MTEAHEKANRLRKAAFGRRGRIFANVAEEDLAVLKEGLQTLWRLEGPDETRLRAWALIRMIGSELARRKDEATKEKKA